MRFIKIPRDDIEGASDEYPAALLRNTNPPAPVAPPIVWATLPRGGAWPVKEPAGVIKFELQQKPARLNPRFQPNGATYIPSGAKFDIERAVGGPKNPRFLQPLFQVRDPETGGPKFVAQIARKPAPLLILWPGQEILVDAGHLAQILRTECRDCAGTFRQYGGCQNPNHDRIIVGGLASGLKHILDDGSEEHLPLHPSLIPKAEIPVDGASMHDAVMQRVGGK